MKPPFSDVKLQHDLSGRLGALSVLSDGDLRRAIALAESQDITLFAAVLSLGLIEDNTLLSIASDVTSIPHMLTASGVFLDVDVLTQLSEAYCTKHQIAPVRGTDGAAHVLVVDPTDQALRAEICFHLENQPSFVAAPSHVVRSILNKANSSRGDEAARNDQIYLEDRARFLENDFDGPTIRFVFDTFAAAIAAGASDVHFEPQENGLRIRFRTNGMLRRQLVDPKLHVRSILARVKVLAKMNVSERRLPQDGRFSITSGGRQVDFRVSSVPTSFGESIVCRVLDPRALRLGWSKLGFDEELAGRIIEVIEQPSGLFLVTGPTGSGKTTTLYTALSHLNDESKKILTVEDPIEYDLAGVEQVQVNEDVGMTFSRALRSFLRQDPNILMVGEIRDEETAQIACRAALVGRLVLSTLHTAKPQAASTRLVDLGVPEYLVRDVLLGTLGQELEVKGDTRFLKATLV